jgi:hypothetical protein
MHIENCIVCVINAHTLSPKQTAHNKNTSRRIMRNLFKLGIIAFAFGLFFIGADTVNGQSRENRREARREYRDEVRDARQDRRRDIRNGTSRREANREFRDERRDARRKYRSETGRRVNRGYNVSKSRRAYPQQQQQQRYRVYYRNGRRYVVRY